MRGYRLLTFLFVVFSHALFSQEDSVKSKFQIRLNGYMKFMEMASFGDNLDRMQNDQLLHNRLNLSIKKGKWEAFLALRTRVFTGETVEMFPSYGQLLDVNTGLVDLSFLLVDENALAALSQIDRASIRWSNKKWDVQLGRQRINWGINMYWNANDLFNAYSLVDFDYEERPGSDAVRAQYFFKGMNSLELAFAPGINGGNGIGAMRYKWNKRAYDWQVLAGMYKEDIALGLGWAGAIKMAGFKGELTYFHPNTIKDTAGVVSLSLSSDYLFPNSVFLSLGFLYNQSAENNTNSALISSDASQLSSKNLMPYPYSGLLSFGSSLNDLLGFNAVIIFAPNEKVAFIMPSLSYSLASNWDLSLTSQNYWRQEKQVLKNLGNGVFLRIKGSF